MVLRAVLDNGLTSEINRKHESLFVGALRVEERLILGGINEASPEDLSVSFLSMLLPPGCGKGQPFMWIVVRIHKAGCEWRHDAPTSHQW